MNTETHKEAARGDRLRDNAMRIMKKYRIGLHQVRDYMIREENEKAGRTLCPRCDGTGNQLFSMYQKCEACSGSGIETLPVHNASQAPTLSGENEEETSHLPGNPAEYGD